MGDSTVKVDIHVLVIDQSMQPGSGSHSVIVVKRYIFILKVIVNGQRWLSSGHCG